MGAGGESKTGLRAGPGPALSTQVTGLMVRGGLRDWPGFQLLSRRGCRPPGGHTRNRWHWVWRTELEHLAKAEGQQRNRAGSTEAAEERAKTKQRPSYGRKPPRPPTARTETSTSGLSRAQGTGSASFPECSQRGSHGLGHRGHVSTKHRRNRPTVIAMSPEGSGHAPRAARGTHGSERSKHLGWRGTLDAPHAQPPH